METLGYRDCADDPQDVLVEHTYPHPNFTSIYNDIALIRLVENVKFSDFIKPICLPTTGSFQVGERFVVAGWGNTENGKKSNVKLKVDVPVVSFNKCYEKFRQRGAILNITQHLCAGGEEGKDACKGDSGSPLMTSKPDGKWKVVGITSSGKNCGKADWPGIYTRVATYLDWIKESIEDESLWEVDDQYGE